MPQGIARLPQLPTESRITPTDHLKSSTQSSLPATAFTGSPDQTNGSPKIISIRQIHRESAEQDKIDHLTSAGWNEPDVRRALRASKGDVAVAENILREFVKQ
ncbi:uncharacterized protein DEA37_0010465 [Paragonimus westermani]|uniref:UBA domain-containing protein n=1 Tax=Paragonimus westermani TaxID=34504 RepID=A0A5J4NNT0_9TREM|nr:uncharacterized protein DEA37_0010465 [Paragonimus westermani]